MKKLDYKEMLNVRGGEDTPPKKKAKFKAGAELTDAVRK